MNYITRLGDRLVFRVIHYGILLHASLCITAIGMVVAAPFVVMDLYQDLRLAHELFTDAPVVSVPLVNRSEERNDSHTGKFLCYVVLPNSEWMLNEKAVRMATPYLREFPPRELESLLIYSHPELRDSSKLLPRIVEVPNERTWDTVFHALRGRSIVSAVLILGFQFLLGVAVSYVAIRGYFLIKYGRRRRRR